jgi:GxxExxY protein
MFVKTQTAERVIGCAIDVHRALGPGLLESVYQACLGYAMHDLGLSVESQVAVPVTYRGRQLDCGYRLDFVVNRELVIEVKSAIQTSPIHKAQLLTYLKLTGLPQGLLLNFCVPTLKDGITSVVLTKR